MLARARPRAEPGRARHLLGDVVRALQLQIDPHPSEEAADHRPAGDLRPRRECRRDRYRRRPGARSSRWRATTTRRYIEPYQGAATGVGGILRDVFTMGARPIANMNALRFGRPDHPKMRHLIAGVVHGIGGYGNCVGVPTVGGEVNFHPAYDGNILVNAMTVGIADQDKIFYSAASRHRQSDRLCRLQDRPRRHPRRDDGLGRFRRGCRRQAPHRAGRRSLHRETADRGLPRTDGVRRDRRDPGHGRRGPHLLLGRDGVARAASASSW